MHITFDYHILNDHNLFVNNIMIYDRLNLNTCIKMKKIRFANVTTVSN